MNDQPIEPEQKGYDPISDWRPPPTPGPSLSEALLLMLLMAGATGIGMIAILLGGRGAEIDILLLGVVELFALLLTLSLGLRIAGAGGRVVFALRPVSPPVVLAMPPLALALALLITSLDSLFQSLWPMPAEFADYMVDLLYPASTLDWARVLVVAVVAIPFGEELLFRGLFLRGFLLRYGRWPALLLSACLFAIAHLNPWGLPGIFAAGVLLGWLVLVTGSLWPAILLHAFFNLCTVLLMVLYTDAPAPVEALAEPPAPPLPFLLPAFGICWGILIFLGRRGGRAPWGSREP